MTHEERAVWIKRGFIVFLALGICLAVLFYPEKKPESTAKPELDPGKDPKNFAVQILHFHQPGNPESEEIAKSLNEVGRKFEKQVLVTRIDVTKEPERAKAEKVTKPPKVVMMAGQERVCKFQGVWTEPQIERKVEQILSGLKTAGKDWRPPVQGMQKATDENAPKLPPPPPESPAPAAPSTTTKR